MHVSLDLLFVFVLPKAWTMSEKMETPSRPVSHIWAKLLSGLSNKKGASCSHLNQHPPSGRSLGCFKQFSALISWAGSTGKSLSFVAFAATSWESLSVEWHFSHGSTRSNEPPSDVPFALTSSICGYWPFMLWDVDFTLGFCPGSLIISNRLWQLGSWGSWLLPFGARKGHLGRTVAFSLHEQCDAQLSPNLQTAWPWWTSSHQWETPHPLYSHIPSSHQLLTIFKPLLCRMTCSTDILVHWIWPNKEYIKQNYLREKWVHSDRPLFPFQRQLAGKGKGWHGKPAMLGGPRTFWGGSQEGLSDLWLWKLDSWWNSMI